MNGIIVINKEKGCTSFDVIRRIRKIYNIKKVGHIGTLDPNATGVLPVLIGQGTKLSGYLINHDKTYLATLHLGSKTTTADVEGEVIEEKEVNDEMLESNKVIEILNSFIGKQEQTPPMYSAIKVKGKKLYELARKGEIVEVPKRQIQIYNIQLKDIDKKEKQIVFEVECSKGTYIRSLCEDIASKLNTVGYMKDLQRKVVGQFDIKDSITISELENNPDIIKNNNDNVNTNPYITIQEFFIDKPNCILTNKEIEKFLNGVKIEKDLEESEFVNIYNEQKKYIGIAKYDKGILKREVIL